MNREELHARAWVLNKRPSADYYRGCSIVESISNNLERSYYHCCSKLPHHQNGCNCVTQSLCLSRRWGVILSQYSQLHLTRSVQSQIQTCTQKKNDICMTVMTTHVTWKLLGAWTSHIARRASHNRQNRPGTCSLNLSYVSLETVTGVLRELVTLDKHSGWATT